MGDNPPTQGACGPTLNLPASMCYNPSMTQQAQTSAQPEAAAPAPAIQRQFVNFSFYKLDPAFRRLSDHEKIQARSEFLSLLQTPRPGLICLTYSTAGLRADTDFLLWRIAYSPDAFQAQTQVINKS